MKKIKKIRKDQFLLFLVLMVATFATISFELYVAKIPLKTVLSMKAVSYTHLDVYKRQGRSSGGGRR